MTSDKPVLPQCVVERMEDLDDDALRTLAFADVPTRFAYLDELELDLKDQSSSGRDLEP